MAEQIIENIQNNVSKVINRLKSVNPFLERAFPANQEALLLKFIHPLDIQNLFKNSSILIDFIPNNYNTIKNIIPYENFIYLNSSLEKVESELRAIESQFHRIYGRNFEHNPQSVSNYNFVLADKSSLNLQGNFEKVVDETISVQDSIVQIGPWLRKTSTSSLLTSAIAALEKSKLKYEEAKKVSDNLSSNFDSNLKEVDALIKSIQSSDKVASDTIDNIVKSEKSIKDSEISATDTLDEIQALKENAEEKLKEKEGLKQKISTAIKELDNFDSKLNKHNKDVDEYTAKATKCKEQLEKDIEELNEVKETAVEILAIATSAKLGGAYKKEADSRLISCRVSYTILIISFLAMAGLGVDLIAPDNNYSLEYILSRALLFIPLSLIAVVANKQLAVNRQAREEYSHKFTLSVSFNGYKDSIHDICEKTYIKFFQETVDELRKNPADKLDKTENEIDNFNRLFKTTNKILKTLRKSPELVKQIQDIFPSNVASYVKEEPIKSTASNDNPDAENDKDISQDTTPPQKTA